jgi:PBP1b-binding outer membrane lipoprotein LpoB
MKLSIYIAIAFGITLLSGCTMHSPNSSLQAQNAQQASAQTQAPVEIGYGAGDSLGQTLFTPAPTERANGSVANTVDPSDR